MRGACCSWRQRTRWAIRRWCGGAAERLGIPESAARHRRIGGLAHAVSPRGVPPPTGSLGRLRSRRRERATRGPPRARGSDRSGSRPGSARLAPRAGRSRRPTRRLPPNWSIPLHGRRRVAASPPPRPSSSARSRFRPNPRAARDAPWPPRRRSSKRAPSTTPSVSWRPPSQALLSTICACPRASAARSDRVRIAGVAATRPRCCSPPRGELEAVDPSLARATYLEALSAAMFAGRLVHGGGVVRVSEAALAGPPPPETPQPSDLLLARVGGAVHRGVRGRGATAQGGVERLPARGRPVTERSRGGCGLPAGSRCSCGTTTPGRCFRHDSSSSRARPVRSPRCRLLLGTGSSVYAFLGELRTAALLEEELRAATEATGIAADPYGRLSLAALRGREAEFAELIRTTVREAEARGEGIALTIAEFLSGGLYNGLGRYEAALAAVLPAERFYTEGPAIWALTELIEAAVRCGQPERARRAFERVQETTRAAGTDWALGIEARSRALLSDGDDAEEPLQGGDQQAQSHTHPRAARSHPPPLRRVAAASSADA